ncbi:MAG: hypothetical protein GY826_10125, partial [Fuerstiella sp.]|nr:hypothetical protein [Fuerstiella sp.]
ARLVAIGFLLAGFTAAQVHSVVSHAAMWPRYMLIGSWIHLPVIVMLLLVFELRHVAWTFSVGCAALAVSQFAYQASFTTGTDYGAVARHIESSRLPNDAFLVQSMDMWQGENHFDRLWLERYAVSRLPTVTGALQSRSGLIGRGLPLTSIKRDVDRVWVYSHLFRRTWL